MHPSKAVLPVTLNLPRNVEDDWSEPPLSATEYLARVRREAEKIPDLMVAPSASAIPPHKSSARDEHMAGVPSALSTFDDGWKSRTLMQFAQASRSLALLKAPYEETGVVFVPAPHHKSARPWHQFCFGTSLPETVEPPQSSLSEECSFVGSTQGAGCEEGEEFVAAENGGQEEPGVGNDLSEEALENEGMGENEVEGISAVPTLQIDDAISGSVPSRPDETDWIGDGCGREPSVSLMVQMDLVTTQRVFNHHLNWLEGVLAQASERAGSLIAGDSEADGFPSSSVALERRCRWLYALMANLTPPLHRDVFANIRRLYCTCTRLYDMLISGQSRDDFSSHENELIGCSNLSRDVKALAVILVVSGLHFDQAGTSVERGRGEAPGLH
jgi:hypothetical protein